LLPSASRWNNLSTPSLMTTRTGVFESCGCFTGMPLQWSSVNEPPWGLARARQQTNLRYCPPRCLPTSPCKSPAFGDKRVSSRLLTLHNSQQKRYHCASPTAGKTSTPCWESKLPAAPASTRGANTSASLTHSEGSSSSHRSPAQFFALSLIADGDSSLQDRRLDDTDDIQLTSMSRPGLLAKDMSWGPWMVSRRQSSKKRSMQKPPGDAPGRKHNPEVSIKPREVEGALDDGFLSPPVTRRLPAGTMTASDVLYGLSGSWHVEQLPPKRSRATVALTG
jgi:hypothetical protein